MDIFSLPHVFLRQLMRTMEIKDRLQLRLTCRALENLVAETNAGTFDDGDITFERDGIYLAIGGTKFNKIEKTEEAVEQFLHFRNRIFEKILFCDFLITADDSSFAPKIIRKLIQKCEIKEISYSAKSVNQLQGALKCMTDLSRKYSLYLYFLPENDLLLAIPPLENLVIMDDQYNGMRDILTGRIIGISHEGSISAELFFKLIDSHVNNYLIFPVETVSLTSQELEKCLEIISSDDRNRKVGIRIEALTITNWLIDYGFTWTAKAGDNFVEFEVCEKEMDMFKQLRYKRCSIHFAPSLIWTGKHTPRPVVMTISNHEEFA